MFKFPFISFFRSQASVAGVAIAALLLSAACKKQEQAAPPPEPEKKQSSVDGLLGGSAPTDQSQAAPSTPATPVATQPADNAAAAQESSRPGYNASGYASGTYVPPVDSSELDNWNSYLRQYYRQFKRFPNNMNEVAAYMNTPPLRIPSGYTAVVDKERQEFVITKVK